MFCCVPPYLTLIMGSMDRCGPMTGLVLCAVLGNKWFLKKNTLILSHILCSKILS